MKNLSQYLQWTEVVNQPDNWIEIEKSNSK